MIFFALPIMHTKIKNTYLFENILIGFGFAFLLLFILSTKASAATGCNIELAMQGAPTVASGGTITRTLTVKNTGKVVCKDTMLTLYYAQNETFVSSTPAPRASNYFWNFGTLPVGKAVTMTVATKHNAAVTGSTIDTEGCATARNGKDSCASSSVSVSGTSAPVVTPPAVVTPTPAPTSTPITVTPAPAPAPVTQVPVSTGKELGIWIWEFPKNMLSSDAQLKQLQNYGFNTVYITIDDYLDIASMADGAAKNTAKANYFATLSKFVAKANSYGLQVDAEGGWKDWAIQANRWKGFALIDAVKEYNAAYPQTKLRGFQYDVEPYLLDHYETNKAKVLTEFVAFIDQSADRFVGTNIKFSMAIPHFYDAAQAWTPAVTYNGKTTHTFNHLLNILEKTPGSTILLMSYRDYFAGDNGTREIVEAELKDAIGYSTRVIVSQETGNVDPDFVTFYGSTKSVVFDNLSQINNAFKSYTSHGGNAVHYLDSFLVMRP
jgi:hypothetical protein